MKFLNIDYDVKIQDVGLRPDGLVVSVAASRAVGGVFAHRPGHTHDHHKNSTNCHPAWRAGIRVMS